MLDVTVVADNAILHEVHEHKLLILYENRSPEAGKKLQMSQRYSIVHSSNEKLDQFLYLTASLWHVQKNLAS